MRNPHKEHVHDENMRRLEELLEEQKREVKPPLFLRFLVFMLLLVIVFLLVVMFTRPAHAAPLVDMPTKSCEFIEREDNTGLRIRTTNNCTAHHVRDDATGLSTVYVRFIETQPLANTFEVPTLYTLLGSQSDQICVVILPDNTVLITTNFMNRLSRGPAGENIYDLVCKELQ